MPDIGRTLDAAKRPPLTIQQEIAMTVPADMQRLFVGIVRVCGRESRERPSEAKAREQNWIDYIKPDHYDLFRRAVAAARDQT